MSHVAHALAAEFPDDAEIIHRLKLENEQFRALAERHHAINGDIHRIEIGVDAASDERLEMLKKSRLALLDDAAKMIAGSRAA